MKRLGRFLWLSIKGALPFLSAVALAVGLVALAGWCEHRNPAAMARLEYDAQMSILVIVAIVLVLCWLTWLHDQWEQSE